VISQELEALRLEVEAAWADVKRAAEALRVGPSAHARREAAVVLSRWRKVSDSFDSAMAEHLKLCPDDVQGLPWNPTNSHPYERK